MIDQSTDLRPFYKMIQNDELAIGKNMPHLINEEIPYNGSKSEKLKFMAKYEKRVQAKYQVCI